MNSFNHYAYGACGEWMYRSMLGIDTDGAGFKKIVMKPEFNNPEANLSVNANSREKTPEIVITEALYGVAGNRKKQVDLTSKLQEQVSAGVWSARFRLPPVHGQLGFARGCSRESTAKKGCR